MQMNPSNPGFSFHKLDKAKDKNFWSIRVNCDIRLIVHKTSDSLLLCYVDHHNNAYQWAEKRKLEIHPRTGAAQLVEIRERIEEITVAKYIDIERPLVVKPVLFAKHSDEELLGYGVPIDWLNDVRQATEDSILELADHLPGEAAEALLDLAVGVTPKKPEPVDEGIDPFHHPDAQRRFRVMNNVEELAQALDYPWEKWTVFLHPAQRQLVERDYNGPAKVSGSAGTGKTIVALHRAMFLARKHPEARVLLTTFSDTLAHEMGVFVRSETELDWAIAAVSAASLNYKALDEHVETVNGHVSICTMHLAKGLEFRAVVVMACDDEVIPSQQRIETVTDDADLEDVYETEWHLLYVACTPSKRSFTGYQW